ncbi:MULTISPECIES: XRE family transcriptional regulator [unclassified Crossiella]|uniref:XRE family transcriptional regulator n=1 Tax=unclassified Crossiella TaxID=2620835 RepID=UPI001FFF2D8D|nr:MULTISPECIES: XRE family transcriptional regulator [unclassified Crossiella]MCK2245472.1 XRE family transcriptional regulator [Crossiella sp. S99.2]MCK2259116.1 XRE family transcriptional regulator [Crossiella sp. S99.1]
MPTTRTTTATSPATRSTRTTADPESTATRLAKALRTGPFSLALRLAVRQSGLSLDRLQSHLHTRGTPASKTALSYWQHGHTRPERPESLRAVTTLEEILGLDPEALTSLLGPRRPRGRWLHHRSGTLPPDRAWARPDGLARALAHLDARPEFLHHLSRVASHLTISVDADRRLHAITHHHLLRAERDTDRYLVAFRSDHPTGPLQLPESRGCRPGRQRADDTTGFRVLELLLDRPLRAGELTVLDYTVLPGRLPDAEHTVRIGQAVRDLSIQVQFAPGNLPAQVVRGYRRSVGEPDTVAELWVGASRTAQLTAVDPAPGIYRVRWDWS